MTDTSSSVRVDVRARAGDYPVLIGSGTLDGIAEILQAHSPAYHYAFISDSNVAPLHGRRTAEACLAAGLRAVSFEFPAGEAHKNRRSWATLTDAMLAERLGRDCCVVAVGGGVTGDLAGFVAATYLRGVPVVQVPTSYLAMVDASVGGKVGVDAAAGKNLVGAFHPPKCVIADTRVLATLPENERRQGLAEAVKHGAILDSGHFAEVSRYADELLVADAEAVRDIVADSVRIKAKVVGKDEREGGFREVLNFGHTVGHALEAASRFSLGHGSAVALGMLAEAMIGERLGITQPGTGQALKDVLNRLGLNLVAGRGVDPDSAIAFLATDKKARGGSPRFVLLRRIGEVAPSDDGQHWSHEVPTPAIREALRTLA